MRIAVVGGTGSFGRALAKRLGDAGYEVVIGSRDAERAYAAAEELGVAGATNADAVRAADLVVLATNADGVLATARELRGVIGATPVLSVAAELHFSPRGVLPTAEVSSIAERIQAELDAPVVAGLHSLAASNLGGDDPADEDTLVCGDHAVAKELVLELAEHLTIGRAIDAGPLASARALEGMTAVIVNVNKRYKAHVGLRVVGLETLDAMKVPNASILTGLLTSARSFGRAFLQGYAVVGAPELTASQRGSEAAASGRREESHGEDATP